MSEEFGGNITVGKVIWYGLLTILGLMAIGWLTMGNDFFMYKFFAPRQEEVRRQVYEETQSYKQGSDRRLSTLCLQVEKSEESGKSMLNQTIAHEFASFNTDDVPDYLRNCLKDARAAAK